MSDSVTVTSRQSWFSRILGAIAGVLFGIILFLGSFILLGWNESRAINRAKTLEAGSKEVISVEASPVGPANDGKLIHVTGDLKTTAPVEDRKFGLAIEAVKLQRHVEMYQWAEEQKSETTKKLGGGEETTTTYTYKKEWNSQAIDSSNFHTPAGHANPSEWPIASKTFSVRTASVGDFSLGSDLIDRLSDFEAYPIIKDDRTAVDDSQPSELYNDGYYYGKDPQTPAIGDLKVTFEIVPLSPVSIVAAQTENTFEPYAIGNIGDIELIQTGTHSAASMFAAEAEANVIITWLVRLGGFFMMFIGLTLITRPLSVAADVVPFFGSIAESGLGFLAFAIALPLTLITIALAWLAVRPLIGIPLFLVAIACVVLGIRALLQRRKRSSAAPPPLPA